MTDVQTHSCYKIKDEVQAIANNKSEHNAFEEKSDINEQQKFYLVQRKKIFWYLWKVKQNQ